ncbi:MAG: serine/threonine-protein kinase [Deltaproteobacteria bacterium]|nr:serine/threonine-protein kinase [Deltaproteobacteria bacterium]
MTLRILKPRSRLGKYLLIHRLGEGGFGEVWRAKDTVEGVEVALKIPQPEWATPEHQKIFQEEVKLVSKLDHHNITKIKNAEWVGKRFVIVSRCGDESLADRMTRPKSAAFIKSAMKQILDCMAYAHSKRIIHRDIKPENVILYKDGTVRLTDFGIARIVEKTMIHGEGTGTIGHMAPEQAYGQTAYSSDVFSIGVLFYQLLTNKLPPWPFEWPFPEQKKITKKLPPSLRHLLKKATRFNPRHRYPDAITMQQAWDRGVRQWRDKKKNKKRKREKREKWLDYKVEGFVRQNKRKLRLDFLCRKCKQPIAESMMACPWCGDKNNGFKKTTTFPDFCTHCEHGIHADWRFCPWCFRKQFRKYSSKRSHDKRYVTACVNRRCRKPLMPFMRYCPYCHKKVATPWKHPSLQERCPECRWGVAKNFWDFCAWCATKLKRY